MNNVRELYLLNFMLIHDAVYSSYDFVNIVEHLTIIELGLINFENSSENSRLNSISNLKYKTKPPKQNRFFLVPIKNKI